MNANHCVVLRSPKVLLVVLVFLFQFIFLPHTQASIYQCEETSHIAPYEVDWNKAGLWENNPIKNQGLVGSCHVFATLGLIEAMIKKNYNQSVILSEGHLFWYHFLNSNSKENILKSFKSDRPSMLPVREGGYYSQDIGYIKDIGVCEDKDLDYHYSDIKQNIHHLKVNYNNFVYEIKKGKHKEFLDNYTDQDFYDLLLKNTDMDLFSKESFEKKTCNKDKIDLSKIKLLSLFNNIQNSSFKKNLIKEVLKLSPLGIALNNFTELKYPNLRKSDSAKISDEKTITSRHGVVLAGLNCRDEGIIRNSWGESDVLKVNGEKMIQKMFLANIILDGEAEEEKLNETIINFSTKEIENNNLTNLDDLNNIPILKNSKNRKKLIKKMVANNNLYKDESNVLTMIQYAKLSKDRDSQDSTFASITNRYFNQKKEFSDKVKTPLYHLILNSPSAGKLLANKPGQYFIQSWISKLNHKNLLTEHSFVSNLINKIKESPQKFDLMNQFLAQTMSLSVAQQKSYLYFQLQYFSSLSSTNNLRINPQLMDNYLFLTLSKANHIYQAPLLIKHASNQDEMITYLVNHYVSSKTLTYQVIFQLGTAALNNLNEYSKALQFALDQIYFDKNALDKSYHHKNAQSLIRRILRKQVNPRLKWTQSLVTATNLQDTQIFKEAYLMAKKESKLKEIYESLMIKNVGSSKLINQLIESNFDGFSMANKNTYVQNYLDSVPRSKSSQAKTIFNRAKKMLEKMPLKSRPTKKYYNTLLTFLKNKENTRKLGKSPSRWKLTATTTEMNNEDKKDLYQKANMIKEPLYFLGRYKKFFRSLFSER